MTRILDSIGIASIGIAIGVVWGVWLVTDFNIATHENARRVVEAEFRAACQQWFTKGNKEIVACHKTEWMK